MGRKIRVRGLSGFLGRVIARLVQLWMSTLRYEVVYRDPNTDPLRRVGGPRVYVVWHEYLLAPVYLRPNPDIAILISRHRDADILQAIAEASGYECVRGSTNRGGVAALRELAALGETRHLVITPDGPKGPRRRLAPGPVYLASKLGMPFVPIAIAYDRCWRTPTWDRFAVPVPFTTCRVILGEEIPIATGADRAGIDTLRDEVEQRVLQATGEAEAWAATRRTRPDAERCHRERPGPRVLRFPEPQAEPEHDQARRAA